MTLIICVLIMWVLFVFIDNLFQPLEVDEIKEQQDANVYYVNNWRIKNYFDDK